MNSELDRTHDPFDDQSSAEFEAWLDETLASTPEQAEAERIYWERRQQALEERFDFQRENPKEPF